MQRKHFRAAHHGLPATMGPLDVNFGKGECTLCLVVLLLLVRADVGRAQAQKPSCMQAWLAKAGISQPDLLSYEASLVTRNISLRHLSDIGNIRGVEGILHFAGISSPTHRRMIAACVLNRTSACMKAPCENGGQCQLARAHRDSTPTYTCQCATGYEGGWCELESCLPSTCKNGGRCTGAARRLLCRCPQGWKGSRCQMADNQCLSHPCKNGAQCRNGENGYTCVCRKGFSGKDCAVNLTPGLAPGVDKHVVESMNSSLVSMQREMGALRAKISSVNSWLQKLWCSGGDSKNAKYADHQSCHYCLYRKRRMFNDALAKCRMRGSDLVSIHNKAEDMFIRTTFGGSFWIGAHDKFVEGLWQWTDGSPFRFSSWMAGEPSNTRGREHCAAGFGAGWADDPCKRKRSYICKICP